MAEGQEADIEIQMTVQLHIPDSDPYGAVAFEPHFEPFFPDDLADELYQRLRNGMHGGISLSGGYLEHDSMAVRILDLKVSPSPQTIRDLYPDADLGYMPEMTISGIVETLLQSMENLRTGKEIYGPDEEGDDASEIETD
jgi:hypothetical protein